MFPAFRDGGPFLNLMPFPTGGAGVEIPTPEITVGPVWTDNGDGTATVTFTTDIATYGGIDFGTSTGVYTQSAFDYDGAGPALELATSHTVPVPDAMAGGTLPDDTYYFRVWGGTPAGFSGYISAEETGTIASGPPATARYAWYKFNTGITEAGTGVSAWADNDASGRNIVQADDAKRPTKEVDGSITFNGTSDGLAASFTLAQPYVVYVKYKSLGWTSTDRIFDGPVARASLQQTGVDPGVQLNAGAGNVGTKEVAADGNYHIVRVVWNGASSILEVDATSPETVNPGTNAPGGFSLGANGTVAGQWAAIQVKEVVIYNNTQSAGDTTATLAYLATV